MGTQHARTEWPQVTLPVNAIFGDCAIAVVRDRYGRNALCISL
jgi:hypothetical protein